MFHVAKTVQLIGALRVSHSYGLAQCQVSVVVQMCCRQQVIL